MHTLFDGLEFRVLRERLVAEHEQVDETVEEGFDLEGIQLKPGEVAAWLKENVLDRRADRRRGPGQLGPRDR